MTSTDSITATYLASNLKRLRSMNDYTLKQVAAYVGICFGTVAKYESYGDKFVFPSHKTIDKLAELYQVRIWMLFAPDGAAQAQVALTGPSFEDALLIINRHIVDAGIQLKRTKRNAPVMHP